MSKIGIIGGAGVVGDACRFGFELLGHEVKIHDIRLNTKIEDVLDTKICFVCVPTPKSDNGDCDVSIVEDVVQTLIANGYSGIICVKSTVSLGTTDRLINKYKTNQICFVPEFLKERSARVDFTERQDLLIIGTDDDYVFQKVKECHGNLPQKTFQLSPIEAEACKYLNNSLGATLVTFANSFHTVCKKYSVDYSKIQQVMSNREFFPKAYLVSNDRWLGWCGVCWSKDLPALNKMAEGTKVEFFKHIINENEKYKKTVPEGMRLK